MPPARTAPRLLSTVTVPGTAEKMAKEASVKGALIVPKAVVQLSLPAAFCHTPLPPLTTPSFLGPPAPSQKLRVRPAVLTRLTCCAIEVWTRKPGDGVVPSAKPLLVRVPA